MYKADKKGIRIVIVNTSNEPQMIYSDDQRIL